MTELACKTMTKLIATQATLTNTEEELSRLKEAVLIYVRSEADMDFDIDDHAIEWFLEEYENVQVSTMKFEE